MWKDEALLLEMLQAARQARSYLDGKTEAEFRGDPILQDAVMMRFVVIGESAGKVSNDMRTAHPEIPWSKMYATRNVLVHAYGQVDLDKVWFAASVGLPALIRDLLPLVTPDDGIEPPTKLTPRETPPD
jgi:uncharacterized protein with HEPN domain